MNDQEFAKDTMNKIKIMQAYKDKYGEDDINEYFGIFGTWRGIEDYLSERMAQRQAKTAENTWMGSFIHSDNPAESNQKVILGGAGLS